MASTVSSPHTSDSAREQLALELGPLRRRLDHELAGRELVERRDGSSRPAASSRRRGPSRPSVASPRGPRSRRARAPRARGSCSSVRMPGRAAQLAMPAPMVPAPTTPESTHRPAELRPALLEEGAHALHAVLGGHRQLVQAALLVEAGAQRRLVGGQHRLLGQPHGERRPPRHHVGELERRVEPFVPCATRLTMPEPVRLRGVDAAAGEHQLHGALLADHARQPLRAAAARDDPEQDLGLAELGRLGGHDHVAGERELAAAAERVARHRGDQRRAHRGQARPEAGRGRDERLLEAALAPSP